MQLIEPKKDNFIKMFIFTDSPSRQGGQKFDQTIN